MAPAANLYRSPQSYIPQHLAERIISSRGALEGERKQVTVLFADLRGSTELIQGLDPEDARALLDPALHAMMEAVHRYEGTVNQVLGDGIMALFGAPLAHEDHALRACYAALALRQALRTYGEQVRRTHGVELQARIGLNSGEVVVRAIGNDLHMDYSAVGETTHLAARMEQLALPGTIRLAPAVLRLVEGVVQVRSLGPMPVRGLPEPLEVFELLGAAPTRSRLQAAVPRGLTKFVGREAELETLRRTLEQAGAGRGQIVALVGEPGVGKSRLVWEFSHSHRIQGWLVLESRSVSYGKATPYLPVIELLKSYCAIDPPDDVRRVREKLTGKLLALDPALQSTLPAFLALLDLPLEDPSWQSLDPPERRRRTLDACKRWLLRESAEQPVLLVLEDLHWIDAETQALLDSLVESLPTARILLLVNYRPEYVHPWANKTYYQQLRLDPLPPASAEALLDSILGVNERLDHLKRLLIARTEGNPFFLQESVRTLIETGVLAGEHGAYRLERSIETTQVPATVQAVLAARLDRLAPDDKRLLQAAAVIGKDVPYPLLRAIAEEDEDTTRQRLARLQAAEFLYEVSLFPDQEYTFKHALTHEVAYGSLLQDRRRALHTGILRAVERLYADRRIEQVERLANHAVRGEQWPEAVTYLRMAASKAAGHSANQEAIAYLDEARAAFNRLPADRASGKLAIDLYVDMHNARIPLGLLQDVGYLQQAEALAIELNDQRRLAWVSVLMNNHLWQLGEYRRAVEVGQRGLRIGEALGDQSLQARANLYLGQVHYSLGEFRRAAELLAQNASMISQDRNDPSRTLSAGYLSATSPAWLAVVLAERGEFREAAHWADEALKLAQAVDHPFTQAVALWGLGRVHLHPGDLEPAIAMLQRGVALCEQREIPRPFPSTAAALGSAYVQAGRLSEAIPLLEASVSAPQSGGAHFRAQALAWLGKAHILAGHSHEAVDCAQRGLALAQERQEKGNEAYVLWILGNIAARSEPVDEERADNHYRRALALAEACEMQPLTAHSRRGLGTLFATIGRYEDARREMAAAAERYRVLGMDRWLNQTEAALARLPE